MVKVETLAEALAAAGISLAEFRELSPNIQSLYLSKIKHGHKVSKLQICVGCGKTLTNQTAKKTGFHNTACHIQHLRQLIVRRDNTIIELELELNKLRQIQTPNIP